MTRSFAWAVGWRTTAGLLVAGLLWHWLTQPWQQAVSGLLLATAVALSTSRFLRNALAPVQEELRAGSPRQLFPSPAQIRDLVPLASAIRETHAQAEAREAKAEAELGKLQRLLDSLPEAVAALDASGRLQWMNLAMQRLLPESASGREAIRRLGHALVHMVRDPDVLAAVEVALGGEAVAERRARTVMPGRTFEVSAAPLPQSGAVIILRDITAAERIERTQRDFVANVSHELRTPLTSITGYVETLLDESAEARFMDAVHGPGLSLRMQEIRGLEVEFLRTILRNAERMNLLIDDLLELSRVESGEHPVNPVPVPAAILVDEALAATYGLASEESPATITRGEITAARVLADPDATVRVLTNLLENAMKYGRGPAGADVRLAASDVVRPGFVCFSVCDHGPGIASEHQTRLFERFYRVDKARSRESGGTGLGLAIARGLVMAQGGEIWCESELGKGSSFRFTLPLLADHLAAEDAAA